MTFANISRLSPFNRLVANQDALVRRYGCVGCSAQTNNTKTCIAMDVSTLNRCSTPAGDIRSIRFSYHHWEVQKPKRSCLNRPAFIYFLNSLPPSKKPKKCKKNRSRHLHLNALSQTPSDRNPARHLTVKMPLQSGTSLKCHLHCLGPRAASRRLPVRVGDHRKVRAGRRWASRFGHGIETLRKSSAFKPTLTITVESVVVRSNTYTPNQGSGGSGRHLVGATVG